MRGTRNLAIGGGVIYPTDRQTYEVWINTTAKDTNISPERIKDLFERYGTRSKDVAMYISQGTDAPLKFLPSSSQR